MFIYLFMSLSSHVTRNFSRNFYYSLKQLLLKRTCHTAIGIVDALTPNPRPHPSLLHLIRPQHQATHNRRAKAHPAAAMPAINTQDVEHN